MCRWLAYAGSPIHLDEILLRPEHSLLDQSRHAMESTFEVNADGNFRALHCWHRVPKLPSISKIHWSLQRSSSGGLLICHASTTPSFVPMIDSFVLLLAPK